MNDEIKEILDKLRETADYPKLNYSSYDKSYNETIDNVAMIKSFACKQLLDYITNLQEKYNNSQIALAGEWKKRLEVEEKNKHLDNQIAMLRQQNNAITEMGLDYKSRNEKAIKCIKDKYYKEEYGRKGTLTNKLMNILQGEDKE